MKHVAQNRIGAVVHALSCDKPHPRRRSITFCGRWLFYGANADWVEVISPATCKSCLKFMKVYGKQDTITVGGADMQIHGSSPDISEKGRIVARDIREIIAELTKAVEEAEACLDNISPAFSYAKLNYLASRLHLAINFLQQR